jgi:hypothetical protein
MLETVKQLISNSSNTSFAEYYQNYIMKIQDYNLGLEVKDLRNADILSVDKLIHKLHKELERKV